MHNTSDYIDVISPRSNSYMSCTLNFLNLTIGRTKGGGGGWMPPSIRFFKNFSKMNYHLDLPFSVVVHIYLRHILTQVW